MQPRAHTLTVFFPAYANGNTYKVDSALYVDTSPTSLTAGEVKYTIESTPGKGSVVQYMFYGDARLKLTDLNTPAGTVARPLVGAIIID
jgi:hypothetical protein